MFGNATHHTVGTADFGVVLNLVSLQRYKQIVCMLAGNFWVSGVNGFTEIVTMARNAGAFLEQLGRFASTLWGFLNRRCTRHDAVAFVISGHICHVLITQRLANATHGGVFAVALFVGIEGRDDVLCTLTRNFWNLVNLREAGLVTHYAVATNAHGNFFLASLDITFDFLGLGGNGRHRSDKQS